MNYCNNCGNKIQSEQQKFCSRCGQSIKIEVKKKPIDLDVKSSISSKWIDFGLGLIAVFLFLEIVYDGATFFEQIERKNDQIFEIEYEKTRQIKDSISNSSHQKCVEGINKLYNRGLTTSIIKNSANNNEIRTLYQDNQ